MICHMIQRTSPKGPGQVFIGTCVRCGTPNLPGKAALEECPNVAGMSNTDAFLRILEGPEDKRENHH